VLLVGKGVTCGDVQKELGLDSAAHVPAKYSREVRLPLFVCGTQVLVFCMQDLLLKRRNVISLSASPACRCPL
jgi:hypothetical protein